MASFNSFLKSLKEAKSKSECVVKLLDFCMYDLPPGPKIFKISTVINL